jgi:hypothetical protein
MAILDSLNRRDYFQHLQSWTASRCVDQYFVFLYFGSAIPEQRRTWGKMNWREIPEACIRLGVFVAMNYFVEGL